MCGKGNFPGIYAASKNLWRRKICSPRKILFFEGKKTLFYCLLPYPTATHGLSIIHISQLKDISKNPLTFLPRQAIIALALLEIEIKQQHASVAQLDRAYGYGP